ncbi:MAG TPA: acetate--CoA ligase family protein [Thermoleophilia bacterium]|nr:acetate--CoA ligase family protein [Thermoleophilia bacterium]
MSAEAGRGMSPDTTSLEQGKMIIQAALDRGRLTLSEHEAKQLLAAYGIPVTDEVLLTDPDGLPEALSSFETTVVLKIDSPDILHKTEAGLVVLGCQTLDDARVSFGRIIDRARERYPEATINGVLVQEMVADCVAECIVGMKKDPQFGPTILFGLGGVFVEVLGDVALRIAPLTAAEADQMVREIKGYGLLAGARGRPKADIAAIADVLLKMSRLAMDLEPYLVEIDINPLMVLAEGRSAKAADALVLLEAPAG